jgi:hypothetical protein
MMEGDKKEPWLELCELDAKEQNPARLLSLTEEINRLLAEKNERFKHSSHSVPATKAS